MESPTRMLLGNGEEMEMNEMTEELRCKAGELYFKLKAILAPISFDLILGQPFLHKERLLWGFGPGKLTGWRGGRRLVLPISEEKPNVKTMLPEREKLWKDREEIKTAHEQLERVLRDRSREEAEAMVRPSPKRYKNFKTAAARAHARRLANLAREQAEGKLKLYIWSHKKPVNNADQATGHRKAWGEAPDGGPAAPKPRDRTTLPPPSLEKTAPESQYLVIPKELSFQAQTDFISTYHKFDALAGEWRETMPMCFYEMLLKHRDLFPDSLPPGPPARRIIDHRIPTVPDKLPPKGPIYQMDNQMKLAMKEELAKLAAKGYITLISSPYAAPCMLVPKKADKPGEPAQYRLVINYQELNKLTISNEQPIPNITTIMEQLQGSKYFTILDMESGFHQAIMTQILWEHIGVRCAVYLDDVLVYSPSLEQHVEDVAKVSEALREHKMFPKISKCKFARTELVYLGYSVGADGVRPSMDKVKDIAHWPEKLANVTQVLQFLGLVGFVRMFMGARFADMAKPLVELTKKNVPFVWEEKPTQAIQMLKKRLINYTLLQLPDPKKPQIRLSQGVADPLANPLMYELDQLDDGPSSSRLPVQQDLTLANSATTTPQAPSLALRELPTQSNHYNEHLPLTEWPERLKATPATEELQADSPDRPVTQQQLVVHVHQPSPNAQDAQDAIETVTVEADDLQLPEDIHLILPPVLNGFWGEVVISDVCDAADLQRAALGPGLLPGTDDWSTALRTCPTYGDVFTAAEQQAPKHVYMAATPPSSRAPYPSRIYRLQHGTLQVHVHGGWRIVVPNQLSTRMDLLYQYHDHPTAGHMGFNKTYQQLTQLYYWEGVKDFVKRYVETCVRCQMSKAITQKPAGLLHSLSIPAKRWDSISMDFITGLPLSTKGNDAVMVVVDRLSKMAHFIPLPVSSTAADIAALFTREIVRLHGVPSSIVTDRDARFISQFWQHFTTQFEIRRCLSTAFHPQTDGQTERTNQTLERLLRSFIQLDQSQWENLLPALELAYNTTPSGSTGLSPFQLMIGENPTTAMSYEPFLYYQTPAMTKQFRMWVARAARHVAKAQLQQQQQANKHRRHVVFREGDKVLLSTAKLPAQGCP
ncbi:hypothetical protein Emag_005945 [Eimeria magna]